MRWYWGCVVFLLLFNISATTFPKIDDVKYDGVLIHFPHKVKGERRIGGWIEVYNNRNHQLICRKRVFTYERCIRHHDPCKPNLIERIRHIGNIITIFDSYNNVHKVIISDICRN